MSIYENEKLLERMRLLVEENKSLKSFQETTKAFHDLAVTERDAARRLVQALKDEVAEWDSACVKLLDRADKAEARERDLDARVQELVDRYESEMPCGHLSRYYFAIYPDQAGCNQCDSESLDERLCAAMDRVAELEADLEAIMDAVVRGVRETDLYHALYYGGASPDQLARVRAMLEGDKK